VDLPVRESSAAMLRRACPPMALKVPPAYTVDPVTASACTSLSAAGFQRVAVPLL
jgi:hypothetical protein